MDPRRSHGGRPLIQRVRALHVAAPAALLLTLASPSGAQTTDDYWRTLREVDDAGIVLAADAPASIPEEIAEGLRLFRAWELSDDANSARRARELLRDARVAPEHRAWHALALAMVYARGPDSRIRLGAGEWITDPQSLGSARSLRLLRSALETRPDFRDAGLELATWALDREHRPVAAEAEIALAGMPEDGDVLLARASLNLLLDQPALAERLAARAEAAGADASVARHARAWGLFQHPRSVGDAVRLYYEGAERMTPPGRREYGRFLEPVLSLDESNAWRATPDERAADWLREYWSRSAARAGVLPDERLAEHYRRVHRARIDHPNNAPLSVLQQQARFALGEDSRRFGLSLRGLMLLRHGDAFRLARIEQCLSNPWPGPGSGTICNELGRSRVEIFRAMTRMAQGESYFPFVRPLDLLYGVYAFRGAAGTNDLVFAVGLPVRSANALIEGPDRMTGILSAVMLADSGTHVRADSAFSMPVPRFTDPLAGETDAVTLLFGLLRVPAEDASREFRVTISDSRRHAGGIGRGRVDTHAFDEFSVSDVVIAPEVMPVGWRRGDVDVSFAPLATYAPGETVRLYYELYGLAEGSAYRTEVEISPPVENVGDRIRDLLGREGSVRFRFDAVADAPHPVFGIQQNRTITLDGVEHGIWTLRVRVTDVATGRTAERETTIEIARQR